MSYFRAESLSLHFGGLKAVDAVSFAVEKGGMATLIGAMANVLKLSPIKALVWAAVLNAVAAVPIMVLLMQLGANPAVMGKFTISRRSRLVGWCATLVMGAASLGFIISLAFK